MKRPPMDPRHVRGQARQTRRAAAAALFAWACAGLFALLGVLGFLLVWDTGYHGGSLVFLGLGALLYWTVSVEARQTTQRWALHRDNLDAMRAAVERQRARERGFHRERVVAFAFPNHRPARRARGRECACLDGSCPVCTTVALERAGLDLELSRMLGRPA